MKRKAEKVKLPRAFLGAEFAQEEAQSGSDDRTFDVTFYSGSEVIRGGMFEEPYLLSMSMDPKHVRMGRINGGASVVKSHDTHTGPDSIVGVTSNGRIENGLAKATVRFSSRPEVDSIVNDVRDRVLRNVSMGVNFYELTELDPDEKTGMQRFLATDWEPNHIGLVAVPADAGAQFTFAHEGEATQCKIINRAEARADAQLKENHMDTIKVRLLSDIEDVGLRGEIVEILAEDFDESLHSKSLKSAAKRGNAIEDMSREIDQKLEEDKRYAKEIRRIAAHFGCDELWAQRQINLGVTAADAMAAASLERARMSPVTPNDIGFGTDHDAPESKGELMAEALVARARRKEPSEGARKYFGLSFAEVAVQALALRGRGRGLDAKRDFSRILSAEFALHTTSDFPLILANTLNKMLQPEYAQANPTYRQIAQEKSFNDFRAHNFIRSGDFPNLLKVNEHGEFKYGTMGENNEPVTAATYGRIIGLSRQTLINDDLSAFSDLATKAARRVADFENSLFFSTCITAGAGLGPDLSDATAVYDGGHGNLDTGVLSNTTLGTGFAKMMAQTSLDGLKLNIMPSILLTSPTSYTLARTLLADITPNQASQVNAFSGQIRAIADANLTGTRYYLLADPGALANYVYGYIGGAGPRTETRSGFEVDGVEFKVALDFGVGAIDFRGGVSGSGA